MDFVRKDGSIYHENIGVKYREKLTTQHTITPSAEQKVQLAEAGLQWVTSSNVSGVGINDDDLIIRFLNGSLYRYPGQAKLFDAMMKASSKGHFVWVKLRRPKLPYEKIGTLPFKQDADFTDDDIFKLVELEGLAVEDRLRALGLFIPTLTNGLDLIGLNGLLG